VAGVGAWAFGMDGSDDPAMVAALVGNAPAQPGMVAGPSSNITSVNPLAAGTTTRKHAKAAPKTTTTTTTLAPTTTTTSASTTTTAPAAGSPKTYTFYGNWLGTKTSVIPTAVPDGARTVVGVMSGFTTNYPGLSCLGHDGPLYVVTVAGHANESYVIADKTTGDCVNAAFVWESAPPA
jgi:hypothetical protein